MNLTNTESTDYYLIGIDGGSSKNEILVTNSQGKVLRRSDNRSSGLSNNNLGLAAFSLRELLRIALEGLPELPIKVIVYGIAGLDTKEEERTSRPVFTEILSSWTINKFILLNDAVLALVNGTTAKNAIVLVGGTGSNCLGRNDQGHCAKSGGLNFALSDDGSGFDAGRLALKAAIKSLDGRGPHTSLQKSVFEALHAKNLSQLKNQIYNPLISKTEIASLAPLVVKAYHDGDPVATGIVDYCIQRLLEHVLAVARHLQLTDKPFDLVLAGSFLLNLIPEFTAQLEKTLPLAVIVSKDTAPVYGAIKIAQKIASGEKFDNLLID